MKEIYITCQELIKTLKISDQDLLDVEKFFDAIPDDEWELEEGKDYKIVKVSTGLREYTASGAYTIARYLEATRKQGFWQRIKEWLLHTKRNIQKAFIRKHILDNCSSLVKRRGQFFISKSDVVAIFKTRPDYLVKMTEYTKRTQFPLIEGQDYENLLDEGGLHYSLSGINKLAQAMKERQSKKNRQEWCWDVGEEISPQIHDIVAQINQRHTHIQKAMDKAKKRDRNTCQVTEIKKNKVNNLKVAAHHLYSQNEYPYLADAEDNLLTLSCEVHDQFHQSFMGGTGKPCTIDDFVKFVQQYYPSNTKLVIRLENQKRKLGNQQPVDMRKPHVLYLPAARVS